MFAKPRVVVFAACVMTLIVHVAASAEKDAPKAAAAARYPVLSGIGVALSTTDAGARIGKIVPGSAAHKCGKLNEGDMIVAVRNGEKAVELKGKRLGDVVSLIRGPVGTTVTLEILPENGKPRLLVAVKREAVALPGLLAESTYERLIGQTAADVPFSTLDRSARVTLAKYAGRILVVDFWASWCGTCYGPVDKMQELARSHPEWKDRVVLVTATVDTDMEAASRVIESRKWTETTHFAIAPEEFDRLKIVAIPAVLIVSPEGKIVSAGDPHSVAIEKEILKIFRQ